jgi:ribose transport system ATP-binding protein
MTGTGAHEFALEMTHVGKRFGQNWVLKDVNLKVQRGAIHAVVGHNGAGKSTLMKIALGAHQPTEGEVRIGGQRLTFSRPAEARSLGLGMVMQERSLITTMTGIDNLFLNCERLNAFGCVDVRRQRAEIEVIIEQLGLKRSTLLMRVSDMSTVEQELIEIAKALRLGSQIIVLDEPTAPLGRGEIQRLFGVLRAIAARGTSIILITHDLGEVFTLSDEVTCLRDGKVVLSCPTKETDMARLISAMLGENPRAHPPLAHPPLHGNAARQQTAGSAASASEPERGPILTVRNLRAGTKLADVSFDTFAGEILGVVGLAGSGRTTLLRALFGDLLCSGGEIRLLGKPYRPRSPCEAIARDVFLIPQDRDVHGLVMSNSIAENIMLVVLHRWLNRFKFMKFAEGREYARRMMKTLNIRASSARQPVNELSGGNQQKVVLAKALTLDCRVLLLDEPTCGLDIAATREIKMQARSLAQKGSAVLWASSDLVELTQVCDRIAVLRDGIVYATVAREDKHAFNEHSLSAMIHGRRLH